VKSMHGVLNVYANRLKGNVGPPGTRSTARNIVICNLRR